MQGIDWREANIDLRQLRALVAVGETLSFRFAAERLGYAQSAVSHQIAALERAMGIQLVDRPGGPKQISLTEAGRVVYEYAERTLASIGSLHADVRALADGAAGCVRIGAFQTAAAQLLPRLIYRFRKNWPKVDVRLVERNDGETLLDLVSSGDLDVAFALIDDTPGKSPLRAAGLEHVDLAEDPWVLLAPPSSRFQGRTSIAMPELDGEPMIAWTEQTQCQRLLDEEWRSSGVWPEIVFRTDDNLTLQRLVGAGLGHAIVGELSTEQGEYAGPAITIPLDIGLQSRRIGLFWRGDRALSASAERFVSIARATAEDARVKHAA